MTTFDANRLRALTGRPELLTPEEMGRADAASPGLGASGPTLMDNAGRAVARMIRRRFRACRVLVLAGPGNNGGDGYVAGRLLDQWGWPVALAALAAPRLAAPRLAAPRLAAPRLAAPRLAAPRLAAPRTGSDAAGAASRWHGPSAPFSPDAAARADLVIDAVFGAGLARDVDGNVADTLRAARRIVAVDTPSGVDGATGAIRGYAPRAELTVTFFRLKPGHLLLPGRDLCGRTELADIGLPAAVLGPIAPATFANLPELWRVPRPDADSHKYSRGHVTILGGALMTGATRLAADAARRAGAGLVTIAAQGSADIYRAASPGTLVSESPVGELLHDERRKIWVCGPGLGPDAARAILPLLLKAGRSVVADADVFSAFAGQPDALRGTAVLTPHAGEFARVFGHPDPDRLTAARGAAVRTGAVVLLKGADTIIAAPDGRAAINASAPPWLATAGSGDVLAGLIGGLLAQGMPPWEAAAAAAYFHGRAAVLAGPGLIVEDLLPTLTVALNATTNQPATDARRV
jgi:hydroxyethylthiazole kinase-like uncharacterized protein yjeF